MSKRLYKFLVLGELYNVPVNDMFINLCQINTAALFFSTFLLAA